VTAAPLTRTCRPTTKQDVWYACANGHLAARGRWGMKVLRESDGAGLTGSQDTYVWGWSSALKCGGEVLYLVEFLPNPVRFDIRDSLGVRLPPPQLVVYALVGAASGATAAPSPSPAGRSSSTPRRPAPSAAATSTESSS
jgi:hypothetical protein